MGSFLFGCLASIAHVIRAINFNRMNHMYRIIRMNQAMVLLLGNCFRPFTAVRWFY